METDFTRDTCSAIGNDDEDADLDELEQFEVSSSWSGERADVFLASILACSRSQVQGWLKAARFIREGRALKASDKVAAGQLVSFSRPGLLPSEPGPDYDISLDVVYEDEHLLVVNKQRGLTVHPGSGVHSGTLVNALLAHCHDLSGIGGVERPGIVHRLDKDTSGLMVVAKCDKAHTGLCEQFAQRSVTKIYQALVHGIPPLQGSINRPIGRHPTQRKLMAVRGGQRPARTDYCVKETFGEQYAWLEIHLHSGRTHQIRVHLTWLGFPLVGDVVYGRRANPWGLEGQALHCCELGFQHPVLNKPMSFHVECPPVIAEILADARRRWE